ncbi:hypothetical protein MHU86_3963 [Fragilaria crotonensis]|nr:hypothetical protein MHU86_3963 [Fragilaria crotonensis]
MAWIRSGWAGGFLLGVLFNAVAMFVFWNGGQTTSITLMGTYWRRNLNESSEYGEEEEEIHFDAMFVTSIVLCLISLTIAFEWAKHRLEESVTDDMEPIIEKLFGEMTVLGFLSMVSFLLHACGFSSSCLDNSLERTGEASIEVMLLCCDAKMIIDRRSNHFMPPHLMDPNTFLEQFKRPRRTRRGV